METTEQNRLKWTLVAAVNNETVLQSCLLNSPAVSQASEVILQKGYASAALAYNEALRRAATDVVVFVHQDVFLPSGWEDKLQSGLDWLYKNDPQWGVAGAWGVQASGNRSGHLYCVGLGQVLGGEYNGAIEVRTLDEVLLIVRKSSQLQFDEELPGFHLYATDICLEAQRKALRCYAISVFCVHNTNGYSLLPREFWKNYLKLRRKWRPRLPVVTPCTEITASCWPAIRLNLVQWKNIFLRKDKPGRRVTDPSELYRKLWPLKAR